MNKEAKVGAMVLSSLLLLAYMIIHLGNFTFGDRGYPVEAVFSQVSGLKQGNVVRYAGVEIGRVQAVLVAKDGVRVHMLINPGVKIPTASRFSIGSDGLLGEKFIDIVPQQYNQGFLPESGALVHGEDPQGLDQLIANVNRLVNYFQEMIGDEKVRAAFQDSIYNAKAITANLNEVSAVLARLAVNNEGDMNAMVSNLSAMSRSLRTAAAEMETMVSGVDNNGHTAQDLREAIENLKNTSVRVEKMAASLEGVVTDPQTAKNLKETLQNAREASERANKMLGKVGQVSMQSGFEVLYSKDRDKYRSNADIRINTSPREFAVVGVSDIGGDNGNKLNLQVGRTNADWSQRAGVMEGKAGIGVDKTLGSQLKLSLDVYDPNDLRVKLRSQYQVAPDTFVVAQTDSINKSPERNTYFGLRRTF